ncbi:MAG: hypothetical protein CVT96_09650 [Bacteroidetes bacterium HGW-Bacteroidetes-13]|nr:MAG: hypothetical protein CVT96_09650 [Bacteroidetes bacterium HGW-Bacteroidetes-13]
MNRREFQELKNRFGEETKKRKMSKFLSLITTFLSVLGISVVSYYFINDLNLNKVKENNQINVILKSLQEENAKLINQIADLEFKLKNRTGDTLKTTDLDLNRLEILENKIENIEKIILDSPEKALTIPLLAKEIENQKNNNSIKIELIQDKITTVIDLNKWILGLIFSLLITIVISNLLSFYKKKIDKSELE